MRRVSLEMGDDLAARKPSGTCAGRFWRILPHLMLCLSLVLYAGLGALLFQRIEGGDGPAANTAEFHEFLNRIISTVQDAKDNANGTQQSIVKALERKMQGEFKSIWLQTPKRWTFFGSMFFCCTVFTTVGYGEIYPVTLPGKIVCVLYAMVGIPLMLLVILDVGDFLAMMMSRAYARIHSCGKTAFYPDPLARESEDFNNLEDGVVVFNQDAVVREPLDIRQVMRTQADAKRKSINAQINVEIFEKILARENLLRKKPLIKSFSCPELNRLPPPPKGYAIWDFSGLGDGMETLDVPFLLIIFIMFAYILFGGLILPLWETQFEGFDPYYFCFITLTTIGFGDIVPNHPNYFMVTSLFIIVGMAIMSMAFKLSQTRIVSCYRQCIKFISRGNVDI